MPVIYTGQLKHASGDKAMLNGGTPLVETTFDAFRFLEMTHFKVLGADYGVHVIVPVVYQSMNLGGRNSTTGVGDNVLFTQVSAKGRREPGAPRLRLSIPPGTAKAVHFHKTYSHSIVPGGFEVTS